MNIEKNERLFLERLIKEDKEAQKLEISLKLEKKKLSTYGTVFVMTIAGVAVTTVAKLLGLF